LGSALIVEEKPICGEALWRVLEGLGLGAPPVIATSLEAAGSSDLSNLRLAVVDLFTINYDFTGLAKLIERLGPRPAVVLDDRASPAFAELAASAGAAAYTSKDQPVEAIRTVFDDAIAGRTRRRAPGADLNSGDEAPSARSRQLTLRQRDVLSHLGQGRTNREIAELLQITPGTVKLHIHQILKVTGARNRTEAALISARYLAVPLPSPASAAEDDAAS
jgi:DNA-binding NarL/FixJ family response regulator